MTREIFPPTPSAIADADVDRMMRDFVDQKVPVLAEDEARRLRAQIVGKLEADRTLFEHDRATRARWVRVTGLGAAAAGIALAAWTGATRFGAAHRRVEAPPLTSVIAVAGDTELVGLQGMRSLNDKGTPIGPDDELRTGPDSAARASLPTGAVVEVGPSARVRFLEAGDLGSLRDRVELAAGKIDVSVPKLSEGSELRVHTPSATVVVHGTKFSVEEVGPNAAGRSSTRVEVREGRVAVYASGLERFLGRGDAWVIDEAPDLPDELLDAGPAVANGSSTLAAENRLLSEAMTLRHERQLERSMKLLDELVDRYPNSPLCETAYVERLRELEELGRKRRLAREAEVYLARYPHGFARQEAAAMLARAEARLP